MKANARRLCSLIVLASFGCLAYSRATDAGTDLRKPAAPPASEPAVYVDSRIGVDSNPGTRESPVRSIARAAAIVRRQDNALYTMKLLPGIHVLDKPVFLAAEKDLTGKRIIVEAATMPDDVSWTPEAMPIVINSSNLGDFSVDAPSFVVSFLVDENHVSIRGIKFPGYSRPNSRYFPVARFNKTKTDLRVEQCLFVGDSNASHLQVGVIAHGNEIKIDHCVFYNVSNAVVFWQDAGDAIKTGNEFTHSIIVGAGQAVWTAWPDKDFAFHHNIVARCKHVWVRNAANTASYSMEDCIAVDNQYRTAVAHDDALRPEPFDLAEHNVTKTGAVTLRLADEIDIDQPLPRDYLHPVPGSLGHDLNAGLFN